MKYRPIEVPLLSCGQKEVRQMAETDNEVRPLPWAARSSFLTRC